MAQPRIWRTAAGFVTLRDTDWAGNEWIRTFWVPRDGGAVRETGSQWAYDQQVCRYLAHGGEALHATPATLLDVIRREYRRATTQERRQGVPPVKSSRPTE